jgi:hypothetical protein
VRNYLSWSGWKADMAGNGKRGKVNGGNSMALFVGDEGVSVEAGIPPAAAPPHHRG